MRFVSAEQPAASATNWEALVVAAAASRAVDWDRRSSAGASSRAIADSAPSRLDQKMTARLCWQAANRHPDKSSGRRQCRCDCIGDSASFGLVPPFPKPLALASWLAASNSVHENCAASLYEKRDSLKMY